MSKILDASCSDGTVTIEGQTVPATVLSQGTTESSGVALIEEKKVTYIASNASDISDIVDAMGDIIDKISQIVTTLDGVTLSPGAAAANIALLASMKAEFVLIKDNLK